MGTIDMNSNGHQMANIRLFRILIAKWKYLQAKKYFVFESLIWAAVIETLLWQNKM